MSVLPSYRNQSIDLHSKSIDWFLMRATLTFNGLTITNAFELQHILVWELLESWDPVTTVFLTIWDKRVSKKIVLKNKKQEISKSLKTQKLTAYTAHWILHKYWILHKLYQQKIKTKMWNSLLQNSI